MVTRFAKQVSVSFSLVALTGFLALAQAAAPEWVINQADSKLSFTGTQNSVPVTGSFKTFSGSVFFDPDHLNESHVKITIDMSSVHTSFSDFTSTLLTEDWFDAKLFPNAVFEASKFTKKGEMSFDATGQITIRDKSLPVTIAFTAKPLSDTQVIVTGETVLKRNDFGVGQGEWQSTDDVKDEVKVQFTLKADKK